MAKTASLVLTLIGADRPGLVEALSQTIARCDGNWLDSRMARLAGKFAGILRVEVGEDRAAELTRELEQLTARGLRVIIEPSDDAAPATSDQRTVHLELVGQDRPGIVREISQALAQRAVNVEELSSGCSSAPMSGERLFRASARLRVPNGLALHELRASLEQLAHDLMGEISLEGSES